MTLVVPQRTPRPSGDNAGDGPTRWRFSLDDYHRMLEVGVLGEDDSVELIDGELLEMAPKGNRHIGAVLRISECFFHGVGERAHVSVQNAISLPPTSEPQPAVTLLRRRQDYYASALPTPDDVVLLVEVADSSAQFDRDVKLPLYALAGIAEVWVVDLAAGVVVVATEPADGRYARVVEHRPGDTISPSAFGDVVIDVGAVLC